MTNTDPDVHEGRLANGARYLVRHSDLPSGLTQLRLIVQVGSFVETEQEAGYAHLIQHCVFRGTKSFPANTITKFLAEIGADPSAPDNNAATGFVETIYVLNLPTSSAALNVALRLLSEFVGAAKLQDADIKKERRVVHEEWGEIQSQHSLNIFDDDSDITRKPPIGNEVGITSKDNEALRQFYRKWYHPALTTLVAVGDFDLTSTIELFGRHFGALEAAGPPPVPPPYSIVARNGCGECRFNFAAEQSPHAVLVAWKSDVKSASGIPDDESFLYYMMSTMLALMRLGNSDLSIADSENSGEKTRSAGCVEVFSVTLADTNPASLVNEFSQLVREIERTRRCGVTEQDVAFLKQALQPVLDAAIESPDTTDEHTDSLVNYALGRMEKLIPRDEGVVKLTHLIDSLCPATVNEAFLRFIRWDQCVVNALGPRTLPQQLQAAFVATLAETLEHRELVFNAEDLAKTPFESLGRPTPPPNGMPENMQISEDRSELLAILGNGFQIHLASATEQAIRWELLVGHGFARRCGTASEELLSSLARSTEIALAGTIGGLDKSYYRTLRVAIGNLEHVATPKCSGLRGETVPGNMERLVQLLHLFLSEPIVIEPENWEQFCLSSSGMSRLENPFPQQVFDDTVVEVVYADHPLVRHLLECTPRFRTRPDKAAVEAFLRDEFQVPDECVFKAVLPASIIPEFLGLLNQYFSPLRRLGQDPPPEPALVIPFPGQPVWREVVRGDNKHAMVALAIPLPRDPDGSNTVRENALASLVEFRLKEALRGQEETVYSINTTILGSFKPYAAGVLFVRFGCNVDKVRSTVNRSAPSDRRRCINVLRLLRASGPSALEIGSARRLAEQAVAQRLQDPQGRLRLMNSVSTATAASQLPEADLKQVTEMLSFSTFAVVSLLPENRTGGARPKPASYCAWFVGGVLATVALVAGAVAVGRAKRK